jgi:hypothetical protein
LCSHEHYYTDRSMSLYDSNIATMLLIDTNH